jgi:hypothetical protein
MNRPLFRSKMICLVNQAKVRGIALLPVEGWGILLRNAIGASYFVKGSRWRAPNPKHLYILSLLLEGRKATSADQNNDAAIVLGIDPNVMQSFSNGFCADQILSASPSDTDMQYAYNIGIEMRQLCIKLDLQKR